MLSERRPPDFEHARNKRQKVRAAGLDPNYWYAVEQSSQLARKEVKEVKFWGTSVALYRGVDGQARAIENRCAHRQLPLSEGDVTGNQLICNYHGWKFNGSGELVEVGHDLFGRKFPKCKLPSYAVRERYGLVWIFFGDKEKSETVPLPDIPELEGPDRWECVPVEFSVNAHHSMIIDNVSDFSHEHLHRRFAPFSDAKLINLETRDDKVFLSYNTKVGYGKISSKFIDRKNVDTNSMELCYDYPYQWSNTDDQIKHWCFVLPQDERHTRVFFLFYFKSFKVPYLPVKVPRRLMRPLLKVSNKLLVEPLLSEDRVAVEAEQRGYDSYFDAPLAELNPAVHAFQELTIKKWESHLEEVDTKKRNRGVVNLPDKKVAT